MQVSHERLNQSDTDTSFILRFHRAGEPPLVLAVDPAPSVTLSDHLRSDDTLAGILLTHLHQDHYGGLPSAAQQDVPIYTSAINRELLQGPIVDINEDSTQRGTAWTTGALFDTIQTCRDWTSFGDGLAVRSVPTGHCIGATGFIIRFVDFQQPRHIFVGGDLSLSPAGPTPESPATFPVDIDAIYVSAAGPSEPKQNSPSLPDIITAIGTETENRSMIQVAAPSLLGLRIAYLLAQRYAPADSPPSIKLCGLVGGFAEALPSLDPADLPASVSDPLAPLTQVDCLSTHPHPQVSDLLEPDSILICGSADLSHGYGKRVHQQLPAAHGLTIRVTTDEDASATAGLTGNTTVHQYNPQFHPPDPDLADYIERFAPYHTILLHGGSPSLQNMLRDTLVWGTTGKPSEQTIYSPIKQWVGCPWLDEGTIAHILNSAAAKSTPGHDPNRSWASVRQSPPEQFVMSGSDWDLEYIQEVTAMEPDSTSRTHTETARGAGSRTETVEPDQEVQTKYSVDGPPQSDETPNQEQRNVETETIEAAVVYLDESTAVLSAENVESLLTTGDVVTLEKDAISTTEPNSTQSSSVE